MEAQRRRSTSTSRLLSNAPMKTRRASAKIGQGGVGFTEHAVGFSIGAKHAGDIYEGTHVINDQGDHGVGKVISCDGSAASR